MTAPRPKPSIPLLSSIAGLAPGYDGWLCDVWGVLHNGVRAFSSSIDACRRFRDSGGQVLLLSNAPRPAASVRDQIAAFGVPDDAYDAILTSGDLTRKLIGAWPDRRLFHLGPARDKPMLDGLDLRFAAADEADAVVCSGLYNDDVETPADYTPLLEPLARRGVPMICANPDLTVERGSRIIYCAGALAAEYERLGGVVTYAGKPHRPIYDLAFERLAELRGAPLARERILAIGDGVRTDIRGAAAAGIDSVFIASAVHVTGALDAIAVERLFNGSATGPIAALPALAW
ncbi:MAG: TIGR01459 family HAD-type hydrolase [Hyphomicrobiaceae bacterium]|nr:TIGR01459 family HAD-type hydrolase [Hyphomicrobiaceae bacterium]